MILLDAYALIAFTAGGPAEPAVRGLMRTGSTAVATANLIEVFDVLERTKGVPRERAAGAIEPLLDGGTRAIPLDLTIARRAADLRVEHYHRRTRPLSLADCVLLASGGSGDRVATADPHLLAVAPLIGLTPLPLPPES